MERLGSECAECVVVAHDFGCGSPLVLDGGVVHRHIRAAHAYALGMGFQRVGFLRVDGDVLGGGDFVFPGQRDPHIAGIFHVGKSESGLDQGNPRISNFSAAFALVVCVDSETPLAFNGAVRDIDVRRALVHYARVAYAHADASHADRVHIDLGAVARLRSFDVDVLARDGSLVQCHVRVMVHMDDGVRDTRGHGAAHRDFRIFCGNVAGLFRRQIDTLPARYRCYRCVTADLGMDALLLGSGIGHREVGFLILCRFEVLLVRGGQAVECRTAGAERALRFVHAVQMNFYLVFCDLVGAHALAVLVGGIAELGIGDALVYRGDCHIDARAHAAHGNTRHAALDVARFFRCHSGIVRRLDGAARHTGTDAAAHVIQGDRHTDARETGSAHAARGIRRQRVRGFHGDVLGFQIAVRHQDRGFAGGVVDAHVGGQPRADSHSRAGCDEGILPVVLVFREHGNILSVPALFRF